MRPPPEVPLELGLILPHLHASGLLGEFDVDTLARAGGEAFERVVERLTEGEVLELLWRHYGPGRVIGVGANVYAVRDALILFKESHDLEGDGEEEEAQRGIAAVIAPLGIVLAAEDLEDLGDVSHVRKAIDAALRAAGRPERAYLHDSPATGISILLLRERLVAGVLGFCSPKPLVEG